MEKPSILMPNSLCTSTKLKSFFAIVALYFYCQFLKTTIMEKINGQTPKNGAVLDTTSNVQPI